MRAIGWVFLALPAAACVGDGDTGTDVGNATACRDSGGTFSGVQFSADEVGNVIDLIEHATVAELDAIPSISTATAKSITLARPFGSGKAPLAKLDAVSGVGAKILRSLRDNARERWCALADGRQTCCPGSGSKTSVIINEFSPGSNGWVELYNAGASSVDLSGWTLDDTVGSGGKPVALAKGTKLASHGFLVVPLGTINATSNDQVTLLAPKAMLADQSDNFYAGTSLGGQCLARNGDGGDWTTTPTTCTKGTSNGAALAPCSAKGGSYDGVAFTAAEECHAVAFLNQARWSEMGALPDLARHIAYDCWPTKVAGDQQSVSCGYRLSAWQNLQQFSHAAGIGVTAMKALAASAASWKQNGRSYDTVADVWQNRAVVKDQPVSLDAVYVTKRLPDEVGVNTYYCVEVRDAVDAPNYLHACVQWINADSAPPCASAACADGMVGKWLQLRGTLRESSAHAGGYKINLVKNVPTAADPRLMPGGPIDCVEVVTQAGEECGGLGYSQDVCLVAYLDSHDAGGCMAELQDRMYDDT
jgi:hypothetical protein